MKRVSLFAVPLLVAASAASAQVVVVDEGSFAISVNGARVGREDFRIRSTPTPNGPQYVANATVTYNDRRVFPMTETDAGGIPMKYVVEVKDGPSVREKFMGAIGRGRVSAHVQDSRGESAREFVVSQGALVIDDDVFHQYYFIALRKLSGAVPVVVPRRNTQVSMRVSSAGSEQLAIGGSTIDALRFSISDPSGADRELWTDAAGRVLKVTIPSRGITALREDPPR